MISNYLTDEITIVDVKVDEWGSVTETPTTGVKARVEDTNKLLLNKEGKEVMGSMTVFLKDTETIKYGDKIIITKKHGNDYEQPEKKFQIIKITHYGMFSKKMIEIEI